jgi:hypothetical protein
LFTRFVRVTRTDRYFPACVLVGTKVADVAFTITAQVVPPGTSLRGVSIEAEHAYHWYVGVAGAESPRHVPTATL